MRVWERLKRWGDEEARSARTYRRLAETAEMHSAASASLLEDVELKLRSIGVTEINRTRPGQCNTAPRSSRSCISWRRAR